MNTLVPALALNASERKITRNALKALTLIHEATRTGSVLLTTPAAQTACMQSAQSYFTRYLAAINGAPAIATGTAQPPGNRTGKTKARRAKSRTATG